MYIINRRNEREAIRYDKITDRNIELSKGLNVDAAYLSKLVIESLKTGMTTNELDELSAETAFYMSTYEPDYDTLATRISVSNLHKQTSASFTDTVKRLYNYTSNGRPTNIISDSFMSFVEANASLLDNAIDYSKDYNYNYFGFKTLCKIYLNKLDGKIVERPQHMIMRVAVCIHLGNIDRILESYFEMSNGSFTHASPTLFNSGSSRAQLASCFLLKCEDDLAHIYETNKRSALISKYGGGIGIDITNIRCKGSVIHANNGKSDGIVPMCKVFNATANYANQQSRRKGSIAMYLQPWHPDVFEFIALRYNNPPEELRARDLFTAMWIPDIFMRRVESDDMWSLFDPNEVRELCDTYGEEFEKIYENSEKEGKYVKRIKARELWKEILRSQQETGLPYISYKDSINRKSNQKNIGIIRSSNLCVSGDTKVLTKDGHIPIVQLKDKDVELWNGLEWSKAVVRKTGENQNLVEVHLSNGEKIKCTPYHKFPIIEGYQHTKYNFEKQKYKLVEAKELVKNMKLAKYLLPESVETNSNYDLKYPYTEGFFTGDGTYENKEKTSAKITLYHDKIKLYDLFDKRRETIRQSNPLKKEVYLPLDISPKYTVPHDKSSTFCKVNWLAGLCDSDGVLTNNAGSYSIQITSIYKNFLLSIRLMLQTIGVDTKVTKMTEARKTLLPDGKGGKAYYDCKESYRLLIPFREVNELIRLGFVTHRIDLSNLGVPNRISSHFIKIVSVNEIEGKYDTYCFTEPKRNLGMFNGVMLGNCNEIVEFTDTDSIATCNLSSISLPYFVKDGKYDFKGLGRVVKIAIKNLNNVIDRTYYPVVEAERNNLAYRPVGLGIQGLADVFAMFKFPWGSENATLLNRVIAEVMYYYALEASHEFAMENNKVYSAFEGSPVSKGILQYDMWGVEPLTKNGVEVFGEILELDWELLKEKCKKGVSNSLLIALMPTATSSQILGNNECLTGETQVSLTNGLSVKIEDFIENNKVLSFSENENMVISSDKIKLLNQGIKKVIELTFQDGTSIRCTEDHKFLTKDGWIESKELLNKKIISSYKGVLDLKNEDENEYFLDMKPNCLYMKTDREKILALSRIIGYLTGDGHIEKNCKSMTLYFGCRQDINMFYNDLSLFTQFKPTIKNNTRGLCIDIPIDLKNILKQFKLTEGRKSTSPYKHPEFILDEKCPLSVIREYIAGHFGADGTSPFLCKPKKQTSFIGPISLGHDIDEYNLDSLKTYMEQFRNLLLKFNVNSTIKGPYLSSTIRTRTSQKFYKLLLSLTPGSNFGENIGFRYCWTKMIRTCIGTSYYKYRENVLKQRKEFSEYINSSEISVKKTIEKIKKEYKEPILYGSMITEHYKRNQGTNSNLKHFRGYSALEYIELLEAVKFFEDPYFIKDEKDSISLPTFTFSVIHIKEIEEPQEVYDISVVNTHNFIANSVVVHNCFEPYTTNIYTRSTMSGDFIMVNKHLAKDLKEIGLWDKDMVNRIIENNGSVQNIDEIPDKIKEVYKTVWEVSQKIVIDYAADRGAFVDQTQSMNIFIDQPSYAKLSSMHLYGWKKGLKTGSYYIRSKPSRDAVKFTILKEEKKEGKKYMLNGKEMICTDDVCVACSS